MTIGLRDIYGVSADDLIPAGGTTGQVLAKKSATDGDIQWADQEGGIPEYDTTAGYTTTDIIERDGDLYRPKADITAPAGAWDDDEWVRITDEVKPPPVNVMFVQLQKTIGLSAGASTAGATVVREPNIAVVDLLQGGSLTAGKLHLPAGLYRFDVSASAYNTGKTRLELHNVAPQGAAAVAYGMVEDVGTTETVLSLSAYAGFPLDAIVELRQYTQKANPDGFGKAAGIAPTEIFVSWLVKKIK